MDQQSGGKVLKISEIVRFQNMEPVAQMPSCVRGILELHGKSVPVVDLRAEPRIKPDAATCVIITECSLVSKHLEVGLIVDRMDQIACLETQEEKIQEQNSGTSNQAAADSEKLCDAIRAWAKRPVCAEQNDCN